MPRAPRINIEDAIYYVTSRAIQGQNLFNDREDFYAYLELLAKYKAQHGFKLFAFSLMNAHVHLLIETGPHIELSEIMHNITSAYTKYYNKRYNRQGHLFRGRYRATVIEKTPYLLAMTRYVHMNPVRLGLAAQPEAYPYSSYLYYIQRPEAVEKPMPIREETAEALQTLSGLSYEEFVKQPAGDQEKALHRDLQRKIFLGSDEFGRKVQELLEQARREGEADDNEAVPSRNRLVIPITSSVVLAALAGSLLLATHKSARKPQTVTVTQTLTRVPEPKEQAIAFDIAGLDGTDWQIKFVAGTPFQTVDNLTFKNNKMESENLGLNGFAPTNYSLTKEPGRVIWETMQTSSTATASWRGEVEGGQMRGILSLREKDKEPQDFSFVSLKYAKAT